LHQKISFIRALIAAPSLPGFAIIASLQTGCRRKGGPTSNPPRYAPNAMTSGICAGTAAPNAFPKAAVSTLTTPSFWPHTVASCGTSRRGIQEAQLPAQRGTQTPRPTGRIPAVAARERYGHASGACGNSLRLAHGSVPADWRIIAVRLARENIGPCTSRAVLPTHFYNGERVNTPRVYILRHRVILR